MEKTANDNPPFTVDSTSHFVNASDTSTRASSGTTVEAKLGANLQNWKRKLLDLSKRNRAVSFRANKVTTVPIVDEQPPEVFRQLHARRAKMKFSPRPDSSQGSLTGLEGVLSDEQSGPPATSDTDAEFETQSAGYVPYEADGLAANHTDEYLQTSLPPEALDRSLRRMDEQAQSTLEEQGVNTLFLSLGMVHYREADASNETVRAPIVLLPVELKRSSARAGFTVQATDDDPIVNPALSEYLRRAFGVQLPELPETADLNEAYDLQQLFNGVVSAIADKTEWQVTTEIYLSFFSFQKFVMYKDLEQNGATFSEHPSIKQVVIRTGNSFRNLPDEIRNADLDTTFPPEATAQVINADASQLRAIMAVSQGHDLVLEGPPGTGKSQTITNLIAQALSENKSVLFVAEKMAALDVVYRNLVKAGLAEFCIELHSTKANKRIAMREIAAALDASFQQPPPERDGTERIRRLREELEAYIGSVHECFGTLGLSLYEGVGWIEQVFDAPKVALTISVETVTREVLEDTVRDLSDLAEAGLTVGDVSVHPWRDTRKTFYSEADLDEVEADINATHQLLTKLIDCAGEVEASFGTPPISSLAEVATAASICKVIGASPGAPQEVLRSEAWNSAPAKAVELVKLGSAMERLQQEIDGMFSTQVFDVEHRRDVLFIESKLHNPLRLLNIFNSQYREITGRWKSYRLADYKKSIADQVEDMQKVIAFRDGQAQLQAHSAEGASLFGALWQGLTSDWEALDSYVGWVVNFRRTYVEKGLKEAAFCVASSKHPDLSRVAAMATTAAAVSDKLASVQSRVGLSEEYFSGSTLAEIAMRLKSMRDTIRLAPRWAAFEVVRAKVADGIAGVFLSTAIQDHIPLGDLPRAFRRAFLQKWLGDVLSGRPSLQQFSTLTHQLRISEFQERDEQVLLDNRVRLIRRMRDRVQALLRTPNAVECLPFLRRQLTLQRGLAPLRTTMLKSFSAIQAIKPVFLMSPLSVSQLLDGKAHTFDLVVFDEASQLPTEDAVGAIARGRQLVVVGDPKQLPPTNFFAVMNGTVSPQLDADGVPLFDDTESILEEFMGSGAPSTRLKWHYRSSHEALIHFSNVNFYDFDLYTFPSVYTGSDHSGLLFEYVANGMYEGKGLNLVEARRVADEVVRHAKANPTVSLGVGTFNLRQQIAIQDELEMRRRLDPSIEEFFSRAKSEPFFVKNLENIQGDERDVILISVTYGKDAAGVLRYNFGPLNGENGWRRLNVLITRARKCMKVFTSFRADDMNPLRASSRGATLLREFLHYAEHGQLVSSSASAAAQTESLFEREVYNELTRHGINLRPQIGEAGYRIDFGVYDNELPGRYICGIECDGAAYHNSETARDRDRLRQQVLEDRGWTIHRLWSTDWFKDRNGQIERLLQLVESSRNRLAEELDGLREAREREAESHHDNDVNDLSETSNGASAIQVGAPIKSITVEPYVFATAQRKYYDEIRFTAPSIIMDALLNVVRAEGPVHIFDIATRLATWWNYDRVGPRTMQVVRSAALDLAIAYSIEMVGEFARIPGGTQPKVRLRSGTGIPGERIAQEEYEEAISQILNVNEVLDRKSLTNKVRLLFGFSRTGSQLETAISGAIDRLLKDGVIGEASSGLRLRK